MNADVKLNVPKIGHTQIRNDTFPEQASSVSGLGAPHLLRSLHPSFAPPVSVRPPRLRAPSAQAKPRDCALPCPHALSLCVHAGGRRRDSAPTPSPLRPGYANPIPWL